VKIPRVVLGTVGKCIYCGRESEPLRTEHIVPYGLNGPWELLKATCDECAVITSATEKSVLKDSLSVLRSALKLPTRRKKSRPQSFPLTITKDGKEQTVEVPIHEHLAVMILPISPPPAYLEGRPYEKGVQVTGAVTIQVGGPPPEELAKIYGAKTFSVTATWHGNCFERMLAKIAYGLGVAHFGLNNLDEVFVIPAILGKKDDIGRWVGCATDIRLEVGKFLHQIDISVVNREIIVRIKLFAIFNVPEYLVVMGRLSSNFQR
jgi:hypothetical protein